MIDATLLTNEQLLAFDQDMLGLAKEGVENMTQLSIETWAEVLRELVIRGLVELRSGSYDDLGSADIRRLK
ncbi:hypothetical protein KRR38_32630 [Novosphingobium sp. G106]|uniref:hypothetical protein n=1 Tax=Novosphingobium sp. G106 TaxID=2849500 RepID=UPI001C2D0509|nr:hypothetical protein [Novosphingobium sp. G106]MBV1692281.1 hypothetical protein [Novosphingobium sp. G106]